MRTTLWVVIGVLTLLAGCTDLDNESLYQCTSDADCSAGWMCLPLGSERVCVKEDSDLSWMSRDTFEPDAASDADVCVPVCDGRVCGPDGCGGECGVGCSGGELCNSVTGQCSATCTPTCSDRECGPDGCGGRCAPDACPLMSTCDEMAGQCECKVGYSRDGATCADIDECTANTDYCSPFATCTNTAGNFTCACNPGYSGNGIICTDLNECTANADNCDAAATCTNTAGGFTCACNTGYSGDGVSCTDVNECTANPGNCSPNATCTNTSGSFTCACNAGYSGNGVTCSSDYVTILSGSFTMGSPIGELGQSSDETQHTVTLTRSFEMKKTEVTQGEWQSLMGNNPSFFLSCGVNCPVETVNWYEALAYANALSAAKGLTACYKLTGCTGTAGAGMGCTDLTVTAAGGDPYACTGYRLPTEAEWEYVYRAGTTSAFHNGGIAVTDCSSDSNLNAIGWYCGNASSTTHLVGQKQANGWGLFDMSGNVWEWCWDGYEVYSGTVSNPVGAGSHLFTVSRGGSWFNDARDCRAAVRYSDLQSTRSSALGFRLVRSLPPCTISQCAALGMACDIANGQCAPRSGKAICETCTLGTTECGGPGDRCAALGGNSICTIACGTSADCPSDFECIPITTTSTACIPLSRTCG